jgi:hypothetical protein
MEKKQKQAVTGDKPRATLGASRRFKRVAIH